MAGRFVGNLCHFTPEGVNFLYKLCLRETADGGIARHQRDGIEIDVEEERFASHPRRGQGRFTARMSGTDDNHIKFLWQAHTVLLELRATI